MNIPHLVKNWLSNVCYQTLTLVKLALLFSVFTSFTALAQPVVTYFHNDVSGSPMVATNEAGNVVWKESYRPYGEKLRKEAANTNISNKIGYAGSPFDASTGLSYMGARYYDPVIGRFMGVDPVGFQEDNVHSFNRYTYANNNPYRYIDRDGRQSTDILYNVWNRAFSNSAGPNANGAAGFEIAKQGIVQGSIDGLKMSAEVGLTVGSLGLGTVGAVGARILAKSEVFAMRTAPELKEIYGWGNALEGVQKARASLDATSIARIQSKVSKSEVEATRNMYREAAAEGRGGSVAPERAKYMQDILSKMD